MKILNVDQIRKVDEATIKRDESTSLRLMAQASKHFTDWFVEKVHSEEPFKYRSPSVVVIAGTGNNGGDGVHVADMLYHKNYRVKLQIVELGKSSPDFEKKFKRVSRGLLFSSKPITSLEELDPEFFDFDILIDAVFGFGLNRPVTGWLADLFERINEHPIKVMSVDMPSGMFADQYTEGTSIKADQTVSFQIPKLAFMMASNAKRIGKLNIIPIGLSQIAINKMESIHHILPNLAAKRLIPDRPEHGHKGTFGHALLWTGSYGRLGAGVLAAKACLRSGVGLLTVQIPSCGYEVFQMAIPEAMVSADTSERYLEEPIHNVNKYAAIGLGPGIDQHPGTALALGKILREAEKPLVMDADALNLLGKHPDWMIHLPKGTIITPHPKEFERLFGKTENDFARLELAIHKAQQQSICIVLKGARTAVISQEGQVSWNVTGNSGMGTAGSGDVLTGLITGLLAQGLPAFDAARIGVYLHGTAGDLAAAKKGEHSLIAGDLVDNLGKAFIQTNKQDTK
ncbi:MAG: NAD(P)H-hydrate dehydratase [Bacteroidota bacterium]